VPCGTSRETVHRSELAGYGYCASHSRLFRGLRLHLVTTVHGLPVAFARTNAKSTNVKSSSTWSACQLDLEQHGGRTITGVAARIPQRILALTAAIWHDWHIGHPYVSIRPAGSICIEYAGVGPPVVLVHGYPIDGRRTRSARGLLGPSSGLERAPTEPAQLQPVQGTCTRLVQVHRREASSCTARHGRNGR
jgi:hypothetical protein